MGSTVSAPSPIKPSNSRFLVERGRGSGVSIKLRHKFTTIIFLCRDAQQQTLDVTLDNALGRVGGLVYRILFNGQTRC